MRPPVAVERLEALPDGRLLYRLKRAWRNGTTHVVFQPQELIEKLSALIPAPRAHSVRYSGVFAPAASWRPFVVPHAAAAATAAPADDDAAHGPVQRCIDAADASVTGTAAMSPDTSTTSSARHGITWSELMKRVWELDVLECPRCHGPMRLLAAIHPPDATRRILECLGLPSRAPPLARAATEIAVS